METKIFLDTHVLVWLCIGDSGKLSEKARQLIESCELLVSPISLLEVDYLHECRKFSFDGSKLFAELSEPLSLEIADDSIAKIMKEASRIHWTRDAFDRILVAHASLRHLPLLSKDHIIRKHYSKSVW